MNNNKIRFIDRNIIKLKYRFKSELFIITISNILYIFKISVNLLLIL